MNRKMIPICYAILAAAFYALNAPISKLLLEEVGPTMMAALLYLGAAKTSAFYSIAPFLGVGFGMVLLGEKPGGFFFPALAIMALATVIMVRDSLKTETKT